jgi:LCP family protein required for cell wall assembly
MSTDLIAPADEPSSKKRRRSWFQRIVLTVNIFMILTALAAAWLLNESYGKVSEISRVQLAGSLSPIPEPSEPGQRVVNVLLVGSDSSEGLDPNDPIQTGRVGERNGDVIIIAHLNEGEGTAALLSIPRDLWVPIAGTEREARINSAFAVGGAAALIETIESNFGIPINHYVNVDFSGFQGVVEAVGSVEVFFPTPARDWNATYDRSQTGFLMEISGCHALEPVEALAYVRSRYYQTQAEDGTWVGDTQGDLGRIRRQQDFLQRLGQTAVDDGARNPFVLNSLVNAMVSNVTLDQELTPQFLLDLAQRFRNFEPGELQTYSYPADLGWAGTNSVLFGRPDDAAPLVALFSGASARDPETIGLSVVYATGAEERAGEIVGVLEAANFRPGIPSPVPLDPQVVLRHGPDGSQAASVVLDALGIDVRVEQVPGLQGRDVVIAVGIEPEITSDNGSETDPGRESTTTTRPSDSSTTRPTTSANVEEFGGDADGKEDQLVEAGC